MYISNNLEYMERLQYITIYIKQICFLLTAVGRHSQDIRTVKI